MTKTEIIVKTIAEKWVINILNRIGNYGSCRLKPDLTKDSKEAETRLKSMLEIEVRMKVQRPMTKDH